MQKILLIGVGTMGREHATSYYSMEAVEVVGIVDVRKDQAEKTIGQHQTKIFSTLEEAVKL